MRRQEQRLFVRLPVRLRFTGDQDGRSFEGHGMTRDLSRTGVLIDTDYLLAEGLRLGLSIQVSEGVVLEAEASVARRLPASTLAPSAMALSFCELSAEAADVLTRLFLAPELCRFYDNILKIQEPELAARVALEDVARIVALWEAPPPQGP